MTDLANLSAVGRTATITIVGLVAVLVALVCIRIVSTFEPLAPACHAAPAADSLGLPSPSPGVESAATFCTTTEQGE